MKQCLWITVRILVCLWIVSCTATKQPGDKQWISLFDEQSIKGWRTYNNQPQDSWEVIGGELVNKKDGVNHRADLITEEKYENFELAFDWKVAAGANSGVLYHVVESASPSFESGPEYQLIDDLGYGGNLTNAQKSGADYDMYAPSVAAARPAGEYNQSRIVVDNGHVQHWLNSQKVADFYLWSPEWYERKSKSKWKDVAGYGMAKSGHIALQDHGGGVWFKNIRIRKL